MSSLALSTKYRKEAEDILDLILLLQKDSDSLSDSEEELELLFLHLAYQPKRDMAQILSIDGLSDLDFELLFRQVTYITSLALYLVMLLLLYRFRRSDFSQLLSALQLPATYHCVQKTAATGRDALLILLVVSHTQTDGVI